MNLQAIKNPEARQLIADLEKVRPDWDSKKKGREWVGVVMTIAKVYPEDTHEIIRLFERKPKPKPKGQSRDATPPAPGAPGSEEAVGCQSCPETLNNAVGAGRDTPVVAAQPDTSHLQSKKDVLKAYDNDPALLATVARGLGINLGNSEKPETIASKIAFYWRKKAGK